MKYFRFALYAIAGTLLVVPFAAAGEAQEWADYKRDNGLRSDLAYNDWDGGSSPSNSGPKEYDSDDGYLRAAAREGAATRAHNAVIDQYNGILKQADVAAQAGNYREAARLNREAVQVHEPIGETAASRGALATAIRFEKYANSQDASDAGNAAWRAGNYALALENYKVMVQSPDWDTEQNRKAVADAEVRVKLAEDQERERVAAEEARAAKEIQGAQVAAKMTKQITEFAASLGTSTEDAGDLLRNTDQTTTDHLDTQMVQPALTFGDPDAAKVPSVLPKAWDSAIAGVYSAASPEVIDRVRKGFQAVMNSDWKAAKAWFQDALNHDPNNANIKRLADLAEPPQKSNQQPTTSDKPFTDEDIPADADKKTYAETSQKIHSPAAWKKFLFPDSKKAVDPANPIILPDPKDVSPWSMDESEPVFKTLPDGTKVQLPQDSDQGLLFNSDAQPSPTKPLK